MIEQSSSVGRTLLELNQVTIERPGVGSVIQNLNLTIQDGEYWAITGPTGSGKTTLAETLLGRHRVTSGVIRWPMLEAGTARFPHEAIHLVSFKEESRLFSYRGQYYQQRFEFADSENPLTLFEFLKNGQNRSEAEIRVVAEQFGIVEQLPLSLIKLSNGQLRRARIARGVMIRPEILILDEPYLGIDAAGQHQLGELMHQLVRSGQRIILITQAERLPGWVTHRLELSRSPSEKLSSIIPSPLAPHHPSPQIVEPIVEFRQVTVRHGGRKILHDVSWTVRAGERWALLGPNGAGKTTLLALACGDHPQAFSNDVRLFGRRRGTGETIWDIKRKIGFVSPEFHRYFSEPLTSFEAAGTGYDVALVYRELSEHEATALQNLFETFDVVHLINRPFRQLSIGQQRLVLLIRAIVRKSPLLILDEPFQGMDSRLALRIRDWLDENLSPSQTLIFVTHNPTEIPRSVNLHFHLQEGRRVEPDCPSL